MVIYKSRRRAADISSVDDDLMFSEHSLSVFCVSSNSLSTRQEEKLNLNVKIELYLTFILLIGSFSCFLMQNFLFWFFAENINISYCLQVNISSVR